MPDDYYVSQYSGEEIDERLTAAHNAVRYDAAQTLTDAQKTQARGNIAAAPKGFGLGDIWNIAPSRDADLITGSGFQMAVLNTPTGSSWWGILSFIYDADTATQWAMSQNDASYYGSVCKREKRAGTWTPWEWGNPPLALGVEYRTTERYLGKPVYKKMIAYTGALTAGYSQMSHNIANIDAVCGCYAELFVSGTRISTPRFDGDNFIVFSASNSTIIKQSNSDWSAYSARVTLSYTKSTD